MGRSTRSSVDWRGRGCFTSPKVIERDVNASSFSRCFAFACLLLRACFCVRARARAAGRGLCRFHITVEAHLEVLEDLGVTQVHLDELALAKGGISRER